MVYLGQTEPGKPSDDLLDPVPPTHQWLVTFYDGTTQTISAHLLGSEEDWINLTLITGMRWERIGDLWYQSRNVLIVAKFRTTTLRSVMRADLI